MQEAPVASPSHPDTPAPMEKLYEYAGEQPSPRDDVAGRAIRHLHPEILPRDAQRLRNQVSCMIAEYHLTSSA